MEGSWPLRQPQRFLHVEFVGLRHEAAGEKGFAGAGLVADTWIRSRRIPGVTSVPPQHGGLRLCPGQSWLGRHRSAEQQ